MTTISSRAAPRRAASTVARVLALSGFALLALSAAASAESPAAYMKRVGNELLTATRTGSVSQIAMVLNANADVPSIGLNALGDYARSLPKTDRPIYYNGMINFIARYAAKEAPKYPVARFIVTATSACRTTAGRTAPTSTATSRWRAATPTTCAGSSYAARAHTKCAMRR